jgi:DNA ligase-1
MIKQAGIVQGSSYVRLYQNHGKSIGYWEAWVEDSGNVIIQYAKQLQGKVVHKEYQAFAKNEGKANATTPYEQGVLEVASKANKKIDKGYVYTVEEATEAPSTNSLGLKKPMLATPLEKVKPEKIDWSSAYVQPKLDGHRALYSDGVLYSRQGKVLDLPHIVEAIEAAGIEDMHLDGELYIHGKSLQEMSKLIKKHRPESLYIEYHIYDQIGDAPFIDRIASLGTSVPQWPAITRLKAVPTHQVSSLDHLMEFHAYYRDRGYEGTMLRFGDDHYQDGKRSRTLLKMKEFQDEEFEIVGVNEGKPYVTEQGTFRVPVYVCQVGNDPEKTFTVTAPGTMYEKDEHWTHRQEAIGHFLTVKFHYYSEAGIPQLPVALRFYETI